MVLFGSCGEGIKFPISSSPLRKCLLFHSSLVFSTTATSHFGNFMFFFAFHHYKKFSHETRSLHMSFLLQVTQSSALSPVTHCNHPLDFSFTNNESSSVILWKITSKNMSNYELTFSISNDNWFNCHTDVSK